MSLPENLNNLYIKFKDFLVYTTNLDNSLSRVAAGFYFLGWLSKDYNRNQWRLTLVHFLQNKNSQEMYSVIIQEESDCLKLYYDPTSETDLQEMRFIAFRLNYSRFPTLTRVCFNAAPHLVVDL